ncbi:MAG: peptidoglycan editing factor PgeF [Proteobacteria bacterium]|nr:peptidoglycan editing factor PgeF [Pseudomonadota bacterium]
MPESLPPFLTHPALNDKKIRHGFFTREGGVSEGLFVSLNCGESSKDDPKNVDENLNRTAQAMQAAHLLSCHQIHSTIVIPVTKAWTRDQKPQADAMVTREKGVALGIKTADCAPVLFFDAKAKVIGAAHAGWRGAVDGMLENTVAAMEKLGARAENIRAVIGPCIQQNSYEVGHEFPAPFLKQDVANEGFFKKSSREGHFLFDLPGYVVKRLKVNGLKETHSIGFDTCSDESRFFSYRRATLRRESAHGTLLSVIVLT